MLTMDVAGVAEHPLHVGNARFLSSGVEAVKHGRHKGVSAAVPKMRFGRSSAPVDSVSRRSDLGRCLRKRC